jgi:serine/threonine protein kinase/tetratricopeptide (TPR) repeat protein
VSAGTGERAACLDDELLVALVEGRLEASAVDAVDTHVAGCEPCRATLVHALLAASRRTGGAATATDVSHGVGPGSAVGRYMILSVIGQGAMGVVFAAYDPEIDRKVALKLLRVPSRSQEERIAREARALAKAAHPNVVALYDVGRHDDRTFLVMELVDGQTLRKWLAETPRSRQAIVDVFLSAGEGLAAAHAVGLVHRDFKPDNVLVARDGRALVADFGLTYDAESSTQPGAFVGTPAYMAPEQKAGLHASARSDQFAFCVSLREALSGRPPVAPLQAKSDPATRARDVPPRIEAVLSRGLAEQPDGRFSSMRELLAALRRATRRRAPAWVASGAAAVVLLGAVAVFSRTRAAAAPVCPAMSTAGVWDDDSKRAMSSAFRASGAPYAEDAWRTSERLLDADVADLVSTKTSVCEATRVRHEQPEAVLSVRSDCLDLRLHEVRSLVRALSTTDASAVGKAVSAVAALTPPSRCLEVRPEGADTPADSAARANVQALRLRLAEAKALEDVGQDGHALDITSDVLTAARESQFRPLVAETLLRRAVEHSHRNDYTASIQALYDALDASESVGFDGVTAEAWSRLVENLAGAGRYDEAERSSRRAHAALDRSGNPKDPRRALLDGEAFLYDQTGDFAHAETILRALVTEEEQDAAGPPVMLARTLALLRRVLLDMGRDDEASEIAKRVLSLDEKTYGTQHPAVGIDLSFVAAAAWRKGRLDEAIELQRRSIAIGAGSHEPPNVATPIMNLSRMLLDRGDLDEAHELLDRAEAILGAMTGPLEAYKAFVMHVRAIWLDRSHHPDAALALHRDALALRERLLGPDHPLVSASLLMVADSLEATGKPKEALEDYRRAMVIAEKHHQTNAPNYTQSLVGVGACLDATGDTTGAIEVLERALGMLVALSASPRRKGAAEIALARALWHAGADRARSVELAKQADADFADRGAEADRARVEAWLAQHALAARRAGGG